MLKKISAYRKVGHLVQEGTLWDHVSWQRLAKVTLKEPFEFITTLKHRNLEPLNLIKFTFRNKAKYALTRSTVTEFNVDIADIVNATARNLSSPFVSLERNQGHLHGLKECPCYMSGQMLFILLVFDDHCLVEEHQLWSTYIAGKTKFLYKR